MKGDCGGSWARFKALPCSIYMLYEKQYPPICRTNTVSSHGVSAFQHSQHLKKQHSVLSRPLYSAQLPQLGHPAQCQGHGPSAFSILKAGETAQVPVTAYPPLSALRAERCCAPQPIALSTLNPPEGCEEQRNVRAVGSQWACTATAGMHSRMSWDSLFSAGQPDSEM